MKRLIAVSVAAAALVVTALFGTVTGTGRAASGQPGLAQGPSER